MMRRGSAGTSATIAVLPFVQVPLPQRALGQTEEGAPASGTHVLIVATCRQLITKAELLFDDLEIANHQLRREGCGTAAARRLHAASAGILIEAHAKLSRPLEHMKQLAEGQPQQRDDHGGGMENRKEVVCVAPHPRIARR